MSIEARCLDQAVVKNWLKEGRSEERIAFEWNVV